MEGTTHAPVRYLPHAVAATALVTLAPAAVVWGTAASGVVTGFVPLVAIGFVVSLLLAHGGRVLWQMRPGSRDLLFSDPMLWGWLRRWRLERHLGNAVALLGFDTEGVRERIDELDPETRIKTLKKLASALEARDPYTHGHSRRVARYSTMIAKKLGVPAADVATIRLAATGPDVGKLVVPLSILNKPGRLTDEEFAVIKRHAPVGADMVSPIGDDELTQIVAHHHERLDGSGYPSRLSGNEIPIGARIVAVADTFDALTSTRAYRPAKRHRDVFRILREEAGTQLDPLAVQAFTRCYSGFGGIAAWSILSGAPQRLLFPLGGQAPAAGGSLTAKALAALATAAATGGIVAGSLTDPRDTSASPTGVPALAAVGAGAHGVAYTGPGKRSAELPARGNKQGENSSTGGPASGAKDGSPSNGPSPIDEPEPLPGPGDVPGTDAPPNPGNPGVNPGQLVEQQVERVGEQTRQLQEQTGQLERQLEEQLVERPGELG